MTKSIEMIGTLEKGVFKSEQSKRFRDAMQALPDGVYASKLERLFGKRSNPQNRYYWGIVLPIVLQGLQEIGHEATEVEEAHEIVKKLFLKPKGKRKRLINKQTGEIMYITPERSTKKLSTIEFNEYFEKIIKWGSDFLGIQIPYPNEFID